MDDENSFVQEIKFDVDDKDLRAAIENMRRSLGDGANPKITSGLETGFKDAGKEALKTAKETELIGKATKQATKETNGLTSAFERMKGAVTGLVAAYAGFKGISALVGFGRSSIASFNVQNRAERMLEFGMRQNGTEGRASELKEFASLIQKNTMYGDEALLTAAGAWQNKIRDVDNSKRMMQLVADFAAKSTGGGEVDAGAMKGMAQQLMQALSGRAITLKAQGFDITAINELQKIRQNGGTVTEEMEIAALEKVLAPIRGMAKELASSDDGKIIQLKNQIGDMREEIGRQLLPVVAELAEKMKGNLPQLNAMFNGLKDILISMMNAVKSNWDYITGFAKTMASLVSTLVKHLPEIAAIAGTVKVVGTVLPLVSGGLTAVKTAATGLVAGNALGLVAVGLTALVTTAIGLREKMMNERKDERFARGNKLTEDIDEITKTQWKDRKHGLEKLRDKQEELQTAIIDYARVHGGAVPQQWLDAFNANLDGTKGNLAIKYRVGNKVSSVRGEKDSGKSLGVDYADEYKKALASIEKQAKGDTTVNNINYTNNITTDSDLMARAIKENLRTLLTSNLTFVNRSETAKALAL